MKNNIYKEKLKKELEKKSIQELISYCKQFQIQSYSRLNKDDLIDYIISKKRIRRLGLYLWWQRNKSIITSILIAIIVGGVYFIFGNFLNKKENPITYYNNGKTYYDSEQYDIALPYLEKAYYLDNTIPSLSYQYGVSLFMLERYQKSISVWQNIPNGEIHEDLDTYKGISYSKLNDKEKQAKYHYNLALTNIPSSNRLYWITRNNLMTLNSKEKGSTFLLKEFSQFDLDCKNYYRPDDTLHIFQGANANIVLERHKQKVNVEILCKGINFKTWRLLAESFYKEKKFFKALDAIIISFEEVKFPFDILTQEDILCSLRQLSFYLSIIYPNSPTILTEEIKNTLKEIYTLNLDRGNIKIADEASLLLTLYFNEKGFPINDFSNSSKYFQVHGTLYHSKGIQEIIIKSNNMKSFNDTILVNDIKDYTISSSTKISEINYNDLTITIISVDGDSTDYNYMPFLTPCVSSELMTIKKVVE